MNITQADRDAAAKIMTDDRSRAWNATDICRVQDGQLDDYHFVQAFARHRLATIDGMASGVDGLADQDVSDEAPVIYSPRDRPGPAA